MKVRVVWKSGGLLGRRQAADPDAPPRALVDVRSHILWGLEYGLIDLDQSLTMLKVAAVHGTTDIVATPRASLEYQFDPQIFAQILKKLRARSDGMINIHTGCDFHFGYTSVSDVLDNPHNYAINGLSYLLVDFANALIPSTTEDILGKFREEGLIPVISHPERNPILQDSIERLKEWISMGCVLQVTARSLSGHFGKIEQRFAWDLLQDGMVYVITSDARDLQQNPPRLDGAWRLIKKKLGEDVARKLLIDNPSMIIQGRMHGRKPAVTIALDPKAAVG
jgi:protein-tyrosine phosphatase